MPIFIPCSTTSASNPLFFGLLVAMNLQTLPEPAGGDERVLPEGSGAEARDAEPDLRRHDAVQGIQIIAIFRLYQFPGIGLWLPKLLYK